ncbi:MAG: hypothetical protein MR481_02315 [Campylobacter sp.]|uniref:hypothetical protein n=1 Tax=Campylobacter sp. TaxID=205 RepID=UPI002AA7705E|nr:hypothetical protein [Campylobacter sp.]MCI7246743.1 hypothetical protein [Campylobacter sp.]
MKKVLLALFLMFGFVSTGFSALDFTITDESGVTQSGIWGNLELNIPTGSVQQYSVNITDIIPDVSTVIFRNASAGNNILLRFNAGVTSKKQAVFKVGIQNDFSNSDYYALSSCEVDKSTNNRPTRSFFIINSGDMKFLKFYLRDCDTGEIKKDEKVNLETTLLAINTQMSDNSVDSKGQNGSVATYGLPAVIIGEETVRDLSAGNGQLLCQRDDRDTPKLYDGDNKKIDFTHRYQDVHARQIVFTIPNRPGTNYRKMHLKLTCKNNNKEHLYYFDARPMEIRVSGLPKADEWLYAEQKYKSDDGTAYDDGFSDAIKQIGSLANCDNCKVVANSLESKKMNAITLDPVDANGKTVEAYNSIAEIAITGKIYSDGSDQNPINEKSGNNLIRPCVAGSRANCAIAIAEINGAAKSEIYTDIVNKTKVLAYNNVGPTVLYGVDTEWTKYSQSQATPLCDKFESHDYPKMVNGTPLIGCNIPFVDANVVNANGGDGINFYSFKPAVYKMLFESKNSPANDSYGTDKLTYIHTIKADDYDATNNKIFEAADFNASILAIGASLESLKNNRTLSHYDNHLKVANELKFSGNPANPTIALEGTSTQNGIAADFRVTVNNDETDISGAIMLTLEPNNPYNHESGYNANPALTEITDKNNIDINMTNDKFYAGKNIKVNKLNLKREDLLARSYAHIGSSSVNIDMSKNADLNTKITTDQAAFISSYKGDDLNFVDAAIIAPNVASNGTTTDGAVYLAGYCESTTLTACKEIEVFISSAIAGHINYFGFRDIRGTATDNSLFEYSDATFSQFKRGADFLGGFTADKVTIKLKGDQAEDYCNIFRNCYELENGKFGTTFNSYKASITKWHGGGDEQGKTIVDNITTDGKTTRRKEQRLSF